MKEVLRERGEPGYRLRQVLSAVCAGARSYGELTSLPAELRAALEAGAPVSSLERAALRVSAAGDAHKAALRLRDGMMIESVLLKPIPGPSWTACISSQVGCAMGCTFCATGLMGLKRDLTAEEIADQILFWRQYLKAGEASGTLTNVVYMGMGEPFHNYEPVAASLKLLTDPGLYGLSARHISVSTVGVAPFIDRFSKEFPQVNLALSLHAADDALRDRLAPVNRAYPLERLAESLGRALERNKRKIFLEYVLLEGENDGLEQAKDLVRWVRSVGRVDLLHINLIVWNPTETGHKPSAPESAKAFRDHLKTCGLSVTIRKNLGRDIEGACGQLITSEGRRRKTAQKTIRDGEGRSHRGFRGGRLS